MNKLQLTLAGLVRGSVKILAMTFISFIAFVGAFLVRFEFNVNTPVFDAWFSAYANNVMQISLLSLVCFVICEWSFRLNIFKNTGDFAKIFSASVLVEISTYLYMLGSTQRITRSVYIISFLLMFFFLMQGRSLLKFIAIRARRIRRKRMEENGAGDLRKNEGIKYLENLDKLTLAAITSKLEGRNVLISGTGRYGKELAKQLAYFKIRRLILVDKNEENLASAVKAVESLNEDIKVEACLADICNAASMKNLFEKYRPHLIFHAAGYTMEELAKVNKKETIYNNLFGTENLLKFSSRNLAEHFILVSYSDESEKLSLIEKIKKKEENKIKIAKEKSGTKFSIYRFGSTDFENEKISDIAVMNLVMLVKNDATSVYRFVKIDNEANVAQDLYR